jgi:hypothetical protein
LRAVQRRTDDVIEIAQATQHIGQAMDAMEIGPIEFESEFSGDYRAMDWDN